MLSSVRQRLLLALLVPGAVGCGTWRQVEVTPAALASNPAKVRVTRPDGSHLVVDHPRIERDSLFGERDGHSVALPLTEVSRIAEPDKDQAKDAAALTFTAAMAGAFLAAWAILVVAAN